MAQVEREEKRQIPVFLVQTITLLMAAVVVAITVLVAMAAQAS